MTQAFSPSIDAPDDAPPAPPPLAAWPPPGLERLQGDLGWVVARLFTGGAIFTLPLLAALTLPQDPWGTGVFGSGWWILLVTSLAGLLVLAGAHVGLFRLLRRWAAAVERGYHSHTVALVLADVRRDTGFLVQGGRAYSLISTTERRALLAGRLVRAVALVGAGIWLSSGFLLGVVLAGRGVLDEGGLLVFTGAPVLGACILAVVLRSWENGVLARARRAWHRQPWSEDLARDEIGEWHESVAARPATVGVDAPHDEAAASGRSFRIGAFATAGVATALVVVALPLMVMAGVGPVLDAIGTPSFGTTATRAVRADALESLRLPVDPSITPIEAGEAVVAVTGGVPGSELARAPVRTHPPVFEDGARGDDNPTGVRPQLWARDLTPRLAAGAGGLDPEAVRYLRELGAHPALAEISTVARAERIDEAGALYVTPLPASMPLWEMPIPRFGELRELAWAQVGAAIGDAAAGEVDAAETRLRELVSAGLVMGRSSTTLIGSLLGFVMADTGAKGLEGLYRASGRTAEADELRRSLDGAENAADRVLAVAGGGRPSLARRSEIVTDTTVLRGIRWEHFTGVSTVGPCINLNRAVFGPPAGHQEWLEESRAALVRSEADAELFRLGSRGWWGGESVGPEWIGRVFTGILGAEPSGTCAGALFAIHTQ